MAINKDNEILEINGQKLFERYFSVCIFSLCAVDHQVVATVLTILLLIGGEGSGTVIKPECCRLHIEVHHCYFGFWLTPFNL